MKWGIISFSKLNFQKAVNEKEDDLVDKLCTLDNFDYFTVLTEIVALTYDKFTIQFTKSFIQEFCNKAFTLLINFSKTETRNFKRLL